MTRLIVPRIAIILLFVVLVGRLYGLQLVKDESEGPGRNTGDLTVRYLQVRPQRGEVFASNGTTLLAESVPIFTASLRPSGLPPINDEDRRPGEPRRDEVYAQLSQILGITSTLIISPATVLDSNPLLKNDLTQGLGGDVVAAGRREAPELLDTSNPTIVAPVAMTPSWVALDVPPNKSLMALKLRDVYSDTLTLDNPIANQVNRRDVAGYQTVVIKRDVPRDVALVLRENSLSLPGVVIERDYTRRYPLSSSVPSLSHLLGYIGRIDECLLVSENPARTWVGGLLDSVGHSVKCGVLQKEVNPYQLGLPRYLEEDRIGRGGVEASYERDLRGELGIDSIVIDATGRPVNAPKTVQPVRNGNNVVLTIDPSFQKQVEQILQNWINIADQRRQTFDGAFAYKRNYPPIRSGVAIVSEIKTGRILAMVSLPTYDNNIWVDPNRSAEINSILNPPTDQITETQRLAVLHNRAISFPYPPGSTIKQFDTIIALHNGTIKADTKIHDPGMLRVQDKFNPSVTYPYPNAGNRAYGDITVYDALKVSSNVFFMSVMGGNKEQIVNLKPEQQTVEDGVGIDKFKEGLEKWFGFGSRTGIKLPGELGGTVPSPKWKSERFQESWTTGDLYNMAIGQGNMRATPLQLLIAGAAVANNGKIYQPQIVDRIVKGDGTVVEQIQPKVNHEVPVGPAYFSVAREGMRLSVTDGPNKAARFECSNLQIAGKTGTAEYGEPMTVPTTDGKKTQQVYRSHAWFVGFAPYDDPQIQVLALVEGAGDMNDGSATITVPAVTQIMQAYFNVAPPNPLPRQCQQDIPPLPERMSFAPVTEVAVPNGPGR